jgi:hypothetical protein
LVLQLLALTSHRGVPPEPFPLRRSGCSERPAAVKGAAEPRRSEPLTARTVLKSSGKRERLRWDTSLLPYTRKYPIPPPQHYGQVRKTERARESRRNFWEKVQGKDCDPLQSAYRGVNSLTCLRGCKSCSVIGWMCTRCLLWLNLHRGTKCAIEMYVNRAAVGRSSLAF